ncbi:hypothetical protein [Nitratifractor sp.]
MESLIGVHRHLVEGWLLVMGLNLLLPYALRRRPERRILWTRIGYFAFWAFWTMVGFSGLMVWIFAGRPMDLSIVLMWALIAIMPLLDAYRAIHLKKLWNSGEEGIGFSMAIVAAEIASVTAVTLLAAAG